MLIYVQPDSQAGNRAVTIKAASGTHNDIAIWLYHGCGGASRIST